jgi:ectoine hydroxylase-related dioxygenase (phytanoyl-CoA dioxygenase family)
MAHVQHVSAHAQSSEIINILQKDGCIVIDNLLAPDEINTLQADMHKQFAEIPDCNGDFYGFSTKRMGALFTKSKAYQKMAVLPQILDVMDAFLLSGCSDYQINLTQAISIGPNERKQILHQDDPMFPFLHPGQEVMLNCMWAIDDFTEENGATVVVPGSHRWPRTQALNLDFEDLPPNLVTQGVMKKGSVLIYLGSLFHAGGQNKTQDQRRCGAVISYNLGWLRQAENNYLAYSKDELAQMPPRLQRLLGYFVHQPNLGSVNGIDPYDYVLKGEKQKIFTEFVPEAVKPLLREYNHLQEMKRMA